MLHLSSRAGACLGHLLSKSNPSARFIQTEANPTAATKYFISRTPSNQYPIYLLTKSGGNLQKTRIKHIHGDAASLRSDLIELLGLPPKDIELNGLNKHIIIKGWHKDKIMSFFESKNF